MPDDEERAIELLKKGENGIKRLNFGSAIESFRSIVELTKNLEVQAKAFWGLGEVYFKLKKIDDAMAFYEKAIDKNPQLYQAWASKGKALEENGNKKGALQSYIKSIELGNIPLTEQSLKLIDVLRSEFVWGAYRSTEIYGDAPIHRAKRQRDEARAESRAKDDVIDLLKELCIAMLKGIGKR